LIQTGLGKDRPATGFFDAAAAAGGEGLGIVLLVINILAVGVANTMAAKRQPPVCCTAWAETASSEIFAKIHPKYQTPIFGTLIVGAIILRHSAGPYPFSAGRLVNFGALSSFVFLNVAVFIFFFIKEKRRNTFGDIVKFLICPVAALPSCCSYSQALKSSPISSVFPGSRLALSSARSSRKATKKYLMLSKICRSRL
jgi:amino acid transporter